jgi:cation diffusion facilitator CzcD-associated flavoprotein CzcO
MQATHAPAVRYDAIVIGAGFGGLYMLYKLRELGYSARVLEMGDGVGGTWYWNRYPGARCDVESIEYSYSFSKEIEQEWNWTELMPAQPEIERYLNFVADRLHLRSDIQLETRVTALTWDEQTSRWTVDTDHGERFEAPFVVAATGCLSAPLTPNIPGLESFQGVTLYSNRFPKDGFDFTGKRVAIVGTGSSGVQSIPVVAEQAGHLHVFQRSAAYTRPANNRALRPGELEELKADYATIRKKQLESRAGVIRFGALSLDAAPPPVKILETPMEERLRVLEELGWTAPMAWEDVMVNLEANQAATELYGELIKRVVTDPETASSLVPHYPMGCKRGIIDSNYFETFNRDNVTLIDLRKGGITEITPDGIRTEQGDFEFDVILFATGFDAMTGALNRIEIRGKGGQRLRDCWTNEGPRTYLGLQIAGFPNLFTITGPGSPSVLANMVLGIEQHVDWIGRCLVYLREQGYKTIEATEAAQEAWVEHVASFVTGAVRTAESCNSWYLGANVPGKKRVYMPYAGGRPLYRQRCDEVAAAGYDGFELGCSAVAAPVL